MADRPPARSRGPTVGHVATPPVGRASRCVPRQRGGKDVRVTTGRLPREAWEDARAGAWGGGLFRRHAALAWKLLSRAAGAAAFVGRGNNPAAGRARLSRVCPLSRSSRGRTSSCGRHPRREAAIARWRTRWVRGPEMASARGTWWLRLDPGEVSASDPPAPSCLLNAPPPPDPAPRSPHGGLSVCVARCGWGRWTTHGGSWLQGSPERGRGEATFVDAQFV